MMTENDTFEAPGKGTWEMDATHCPKPLAGVLQEVFGPGLGEGMRRSAERYGLLLETLIVRYVEGFPYVQPKPVGAPAGGTGLPPKLVFKLATWLHPAIRRRLKTASEVFEAKPWIAELEDWDRRVKPQTIEAHRGWARLDIAALSDAELAERIPSFVAHVRAMVTQDHSYNCTFMLPLGDYLAQVSSWTGANGAELMALLTGYSGASTGDLAERRRLLQEIDEDHEAKALLASDVEPAAVMAQLTAHEGSLGDAFADYLLFTGGGELGVDLMVPAICERPEVVIASLREALKSPPCEDDGVAGLEAEVRERVPPEHRKTFDELLADARRVYRLRDERHLYGAIPCIVVGRRLLLEAGRRLVARGQLERAEHALQAFSFELTEALTGQRDVDADELARRMRRYEALDGWSVPATFGPKPERPPSEWLPPAARRVGEALEAYFQHANVEPPEATQRQGDALSGLGVSAGTCEGPARLCTSAGDLDRIEKGDILIAQTTTVAINGHLPLLAGVVTDRGGALSHAAIVCREYGIPGVVGTREATKRIADGARIRVDGDAGTVRLL